MHCEKFEARLNELLDQRAPLELEGALRAHYRRCRECRRLFKAYRELTHSVRLSPLPQPSAELTERIVAAAYREVTTPREATSPVSASADKVVRRPAREVRSRVWQWSVAAAVSAAVLVAVSASILAPRVERPEHQRQIAQPAKEAAPPQALASLARDATSQYLKLAQETRREVADALVLLPRVKAPATLLEEGVPLRGNPSEVALHMADALKPLARSTVDTFGFLFAAPRADNGGL